MKIKGIILLVLLVLGVLLIVFAMSRQDGVKPVALELSVPDISLVDPSSGARLSPAEIANKVLLINFWASWCKPCKDEMPSIQALYDEIHENSDFRMITILYKDSEDNAISYMKENGFTFPVYADPDGKTARNFGVTGVPETYIVNKKGILKKKVIGPSEWNSPDEKSFITALLKE